MGLFSSKEENKRRQSDADADADAGEGREGEGESSDAMVEERPASAAGQPAEDSKEDE